MTEQFAAFTESLASYFKSYGGWRAVFTSPFFIVAIVITFLSYSCWIEPLWVEQTKALIPNLLGFSLGSYTILFALVNGKLKDALQSVKNDAGVPYIDVVNATFLHFILVQIVALLWAFLFSGSAVRDICGLVSVHLPWIDNLFMAIYMASSFAGYLLMIYSILLVLGAGLAIYRLALIRVPK